MSATSIEWTKRPGTIGETWNPTTGCNKVDRGCKNCYAEIMHRRLMVMMPEKYKLPFLSGAVIHPETLDIPSRWKKPRTVFVDSMSDLFHANVPMHFLQDVFGTMEIYDAHTYLILTKRPERALEFWEYMRAKIPGWKPGPHIWIGTSANDQESADKRIPLLLKLDVGLRFLSYEPATGPLNLRAIGSLTDPVDALNGIAFMPGFHGVLHRDHPRLHWVICGGESGSKATPMHPAWARKVRDDCRKAGVPFFFKQHGHWSPINYYTEKQELKISFTLGKNEYLFTEPSPQNMVKLGKKKSGHLLDGQTIQQFPETPKHVENRQPDRERRSGAVRS